MYNNYIKFVREIYNTNELIPLHEPKFQGNEKKYLNESIDSTFVSSVGKFVDRFEKDITEYTGAKYAVATVNGTAALHIALILAGVELGNEVITQPLTFVATANAISYCNADPVFIDVDRDTMGLSPEKLESFLKKNTRWDPIVSKLINTTTQNPITACVPMHTFGHPCRIDEIKEICLKYNIALIEDAAESIGSLYKEKHTGTFGDLGIFSFNGNKIITCGGGGIIVTDDKVLAEQAKHITTTAKLPHKWEYSHDTTGYNYRMPNLNAAIACAQLEQLSGFIEKKRVLADRYRDFFEDSGINLFIEPEFARSNYWLNAVILNDREERDKFLEFTNKNNVMTRPVWELTNRLPMFKTCECGDLSNSEWFEDRVVNIPSSVILKY